MRITVLTILLLSLCVSCGKQNKKGKHPSSEKDIISLKSSWHITSTTDWVNNQGLLNVESIVHDASNQVFYASNGENYGLGTNGFISKISKDGTLQELKWIEGLNRPTGMAIRDSLLYVADVNALIVINTKKGTVVERFLEPVTNSGLNDVAINDKGEVYVSASFVHSICKLKDGELILWAKDEERLKWANGLVATNKEIIVAGLDISTIDLDSRRIDSIQLNPSIKDFDGLIPDGNDGFFVTTVENSGFYHINKQMQVTKILEDAPYFGDLEFDRANKTIYIPRGNRKTNEFYITVCTMEEWSDTKNR
nr:hypothetical protein [uncultured Allomuricauda sp.]